MRHGLALVALLLPLSGCVVPPQPVGYGYGYQEQGYPGGDYNYPGYSYNDGSPTLVVEGAPMPLIYFGGAWGYYDGARRWHRAPDGVDRHLAQRFPGGAGYRPWGGGFGRPEGFRREGFRPEGFRQQGYRPEGMRPEGFRPDAGRPWQGRPEGPRAGGYQPGGNPYANRPGGPGPGPGPIGVGGRFQPQVQRANVPESRPAPQERHRNDDRR